jgi:hypothetical protein
MIIISIHSSTMNSHRTFRPYLINVICGSTSKYITSMSARDIV